MLTETARRDLAALRAAGYSPTDDEIIRLNDLAIRIERGKETTPANMPRVGFAGNVILHEPTIGAIEWWNDYGRNAAWTSNGRLMTYFFMLAHARSLDYLATLQRPKDVRKAVRKWRRTVDATETELWRALMWVKYGADDIAADVKRKIHDSMENEETMDALWFNLISAAGAVGVTPDDLKTNTQSELVALLVQANIHARIPMKQSIAEDYLAYRQTMRQIEERGKNG